MTLRQFAARPEAIPTATTWHLADLGEARGKQELYTRQSPQCLKALREHAIIESAVSSNRIEGVEVDKRRVRTIVFGKPLLRDRAEEEVRGYRDALGLIHERGADLPLDDETILRLHRLARGSIWDAGQYRTKGGEIIEILPDGRRRVRFRATEAEKVPAAIGELVEQWHGCLDEKWIHPLVALPAFNLDFLCIHPFRDGNGRVSRLLLLLQCYHLGYEVGRYISIERLIEHHKERYYETLEDASHHWHEGHHNPWPYINFVLYILKTAYTELGDRLAHTKVPRGAKGTRVRQAIDAFPDRFTLAELERACPGVSHDMIRRVLRQLRCSGQVECLGRGPGAQWSKKG